MSITVTRPPAAEEEPPALPPLARRPAIVEWLTSVDHKTVGLAYLYTAVVFAIAVAISALVVRLELWTPGLQILHSDTAGQWHTLFATASYWLYLIPAFIGLAVY